MAEIFTIDIKFRPQFEKKLIIPERISIPKNSQVFWNITQDEHFDDYFIHQRVSSNLRFKIYFDGKSPFRWHDQHLIIYGYRYNQNKFQLAEGVPEMTGEYKYGVKVSDGESNETIYDEDPFLIIY